MGLLVFGNGDGGGGPLAKMLENVSPVRFSRIPGIPAYIATRWATYFISTFFRSNSPIPLYDHVPTASELLCSADTLATSNSSVESARQATTRANYPS
jgi:hypothetical protein